MPPMPKLKLCVGSPSRVDAIEIAARSESSTARSNKECVKFVLVRREKSESLGTPPSISGNGSTACKPMQVRGTRLQQWPNWSLPGSGFCAGSPCAALEVQCDLRTTFVNWHSLSLSLNAATPGSSLPSSNSSDAPPPVERTSSWPQAPPV